MHNATALTVMTWTVGLTTMLTGSVHGQDPSPPPQTSPASTTLPAAPRPGALPTATYAQLKAGFADPDMAYAPYALWHWDAPLSVEQVAEQARHMVEQGSNPGYVCAGPGLPREQWLSPLWFEAFGAALAEAERAGASLGYGHDQQGAGEQVLAQHPELAATSLRWQVRDVQGPQVVDIPEGLFSVAAQLAPPPQTRPAGEPAPAAFTPPVRVLSATLQIVANPGPARWAVPEGNWRIYTFVLFHPPGGNGKTVNTLDRRLPEALLTIAHEPYARQLSEHFDRTITGAMVTPASSPGSRLAWSDDLMRLYQQRKGRDLRLWMPLMVDEDVEGLWMRARWDWHDTVSELNGENTLGRISRWLEARGMHCTSNICQDSLYHQATAGGDPMRAQRTISLPGQICPSLEVRNVKETASVCAFEARRFMSSISTPAGGQMSSAMLRQAANTLIGWGISHVIVDGVHLSRLSDRTDTPSDGQSSSNFLADARTLNDFVRRAGYVNSHGHPVPDVLLLNPKDSVFALIGGAVYDADQPMLPTIEQSPCADTLRRIESTYSQAIRDLTTARIEFLIADAHYLQQMEITPQGRLKHDEFTFGAVVLPPLKLLPLRAAETIANFALAGGHVYLLGELPEGSTENGLHDPRLAKLLDPLRILATVREAPEGIPGLLRDRAMFLRSPVRFEEGEFAMLQQRRRIDGRECYWLANNTDQPRTCTVTVAEAHGQAARWSCETGGIDALPSEELRFGSRLRLHFAPAEAYWLVFDPQLTALPADPASPPASAR